MVFLKTLRIATSGLNVQAGRMRIIAENIANAETTSTVVGGLPYQRKIPTFKQSLDKEFQVETVNLGKIALDKRPFRLSYEPGHPLADSDGYVKRPSVEITLEAIDMRSAQRAYEANLNVVTATRKMVSSIIGLLKSA